MLALISSLGRAGNQWQQGIDHKFITEESAAGPGSFLPAEMDLCLPSRVGSPSRAAPSAVIPHLPGPGLHRASQAGSSSVVWPKATWSTIREPQLPRSIAAAGSSCAGPRSTRCPARCAASGSAPASRVPARPGCCCRLTAELLFHASLVLLACN